MAMLLLPTVTSDESLTGVCRKSQDECHYRDVYLGVLPSITWFLDELIAGLRVESRPKPHSRPRSQR
jgi:hypothetical protein